MNTRLLVLSACMLASGLAQAVQVLPISYSMPNGTSSSYTYWDDTYNGIGCVTCNGAALSGGLGDLTDGVVADTSWNVAEAPEGPGPYVGWSNINPAITFNFGQLVSIGSVTFHFDDSDVGGVGAPASVTIAGQTYPVIDPAGPDPFAFTVSGLTFAGSSLGVVINRTGSFTFLSEVTFQSPIPEQGTGMMFLTGLAAMFFVSRRFLRPL